jgi:hypothetical protein
MVHEESEILFKPEHRTSIGKCALIVLTSFISFSSSSFNCLVLSDVMLSRCSARCCFMGTTSRTFSVWTEFTVSTSKKVDTRETCHWSHAWPRFKQSKRVRLNGIPECKFLSRNAHSAARSGVSGIIGCWGVLDDGEGREPCPFWDQLCQCIELGNGCTRW